MLILLSHPLIQLPFRLRVHGGGDVLLHAIEDYIDSQKLIYPTQQAETARADDIYRQNQISQSGIYNRFVSLRCRIAFEDIV